MLRTNSGKPISSSSRLIWRLTVGCVVKNSFAVLVKFRWFARDKNNSICCVVIGSFPFLTAEALSSAGAGDRADSLFVCIYFSIIRMLHQSDCDAIHKICKKGIDKTEKEYYCIKQVIQ